MVRLQQVLVSWGGIRQDTAAAVEDFPAEEIGFRPAPDKASFGEITRYILDAGDRLLGICRNR